MTVKSQHGCCKELPLWHEAFPAALQPDWSWWPEGIFGVSVDWGPWRRWNWQLAPRLPGLAPPGSATNSFTAAGSRVRGVGQNRSSPLSLLAILFIFFKKVCDPSRVAFSDCFLLHRVSCRLLSSPLLRACCSAREGVGGLCGVVFIRVLKDRAVGDLKKKIYIFLYLVASACA